MRHVPSRPGGIPRRTFVLILACAPIMPRTAAAQEDIEQPPARHYNVATGAIKGKRLRANTDIRVVVTGVNPFCYSGINATLEPVEGKVDTKSFIAGFSPPPVETVNAPGRSGTPAEGPPAPSSVAGVEPTPSEKAAAFLTTATGALNAASDLLTPAATRSNLAASIIQAVDKPPCDLGPGWDGTSVLREWGAVRGTLPGSLDEAQGDVRRARTQLAGVTTSLAQAEVVLAGLPSNAQNDELKRRAAAERQRLAGLEAAAVQLTNLLPGQIDAIRRINPQYAAFEAAAQAKWEPSGEATHETESAKLTINLIPRPNTSAKEQQIVRQFRVDRSFRMFLSTGVLVTGLPQPNYERVTRLVGEDSTYQTYADQNRGPLSVVSPSLQYNMSFTELNGAAGGVPLLASFGVALRSVRDQPLPEPFAGISLGLIDRFVITGGLHFGRREELLITQENEEPEDVEKRAVPDEITPAEAIGVRWKPAFFFTLSIRT